MEGGASSKRVVGAGRKPVLGTPAGGDAGIGNRRSAPMKRMAPEVSLLIAFSNTPGKATSP